MQDLLPPLTAHSAGFEPAQVRQLTVYMDNRVGQLQQLVRIYEQAGGRIISLVVQNAVDTALIRLICSDTPLAQRELAQAGYAYSCHPLLLVEVDQKAALPLTSLCAALLAAEINIHYVYPLLLPPRGPAIVLHVDDPILAAQVLVRKNYRLIAESELAGE
jgi:hypothetical protein